jgi:hypothetical protein
MKTLKQGASEEDEGFIFTDKKEDGYYRSVQLGIWNFIEQITVI